MEFDDRIRELVAVGASVTANCQPCLRYHATKAKEAGASQGEITEAVEVGKMVRRGATSKMDDFASTLTQEIPSAAGIPDKGCGCSS